MRRAGHFAVNVLGRRHECFARRATPPGADRFVGLDWKPGRSGGPLLADGLAQADWHEFEQDWHFCRPPPRRRGVDDGCERLGAPSVEALLGADGLGRNGHRLELHEFPQDVLVLTVLSLNVFGDGVRDALDPRAKVRLER
jgi:hypothetical protein